MHTGCSHGLYISALSFEVLLYLLWCVCCARLCCVFCWGKAIVVLDMLWEKSLQVLTRVLCLHFWGFLLNSGLQLFILESFITSLSIGSVATVAATAVQIVFLLWCFAIVVVCCVCYWAYVLKVLVALSVCCYCFCHCATCAASIQCVHTTAFSFSFCNSTTATTTTKNDL